MLQIRLHKKFDPFELHADLCLNGKVTGLFGPSGSGKTTLLNCLAGLMEPDDGNIRLDETELFDKMKRINIGCRHRHFGYVFQDGLLFEHLTVEQNLTYSRHARPGPKLAQVVDVLELGRLFNRKAINLSGGEKRRVAIGRALLSAPRLLLLDEPLTGLDRRLSGKTLGYIRSVLDAFDIPTVYVSHSISDIVYLCDEVVVLNRGKVVEQGAPRELLTAMVSADREPHPALKNIFTVDVRETHAKDGTIVCDLGDQLLSIAGSAPPAGQQITAMVYARDIILANERPGMLSARNILKGRITRMDPHDGRCVVSVDVGIVWMVEITASAAIELDLKEGNDVFVIAKASAIQSLER